MAGIIYTLCALTAFLCAWMLLKAYYTNKYRLLLWGGLCFTGLTVSNVILVMDKIIFPGVDFSTWRYMISLASMVILLYGLIWDSE
jgi:hypothetical protein